MNQDLKKIFSKINIFKRLPKVDVKQIKLPETIAGNANLDKKLVFSLAKKRFPSWQQLQYLPQYLSTKEKIIIRILVVLIIINLGWLVVNFYQRHVIYLPRDGGSYSEALVGQPTYVNTILAQNDVDRDLSKLIYSGLFKYNQDLELVPDLADSYEISEDKLTYTIKLKSGVKWHNQNELLADDVIYTFEIIQDEEFNSPLSSSFSEVQIERIDDHTVTFTLPKPFTPFLSNLTVGIMPGHIWNDVSPSNFRLAEYNTKPIGSGPFKFKELTKDRSGNIKSYTLEKNEDYYGPEPYLESIIFKFYPDFDSAISAAKNKSVDGVSYVPTDLEQTLRENKNINIHSLQLPQYTALFINQKNSLLKSNELKQALAQAVDKEKILEQALMDHGIIINGPILEGLLGYHPDIKKYEFNPMKAAEALDALDWKVPEEGGLRQKDGNELKFSLTTVDQPEYLKTANILRENWEAINIGIELKIMNPLRVDKEVIKPRNYETFLYGEILGSDPDPYPFWHSSQSLNGGLNLSNYYNKEVDKILEEARQLDNPDERAQKYIEFQNIIAEEVPAIFLYSPQYDYGMHKKIKGINTKRITVPSDRFNGIEDWYAKTKIGWE